MLDFDQIRIAPATQNDVADIKHFLTDAGLPTEGVDDHWRTFVLAREGKRLIGCGGSEAYSFVALLRSLVVLPEYRSHGLGRRLVRELLDRLSARGLREFYLLTTDAEEYFRKRGFKPIDRDEVNPQLMASTQFQGACPETAICMRLMMMS